MKSLKISFVLVAIAGLASIYTYIRYLDHYTSPYLDVVINSHVLGESRKIFIRLPDKYNAQKSYPLVIKTDGNFNLNRWAETVAKHDDAIVVAIPNQFWTDTRNRDLVPPFARKDVNINARPTNQTARELFGRADTFLAFIRTELLPYIESRYKISNDRSLSGYSAGGSFVLYTMITHPSLFNAYFAFSPAAWYDDSVVVKEFKKNLFKLEGAPKFFYLSLGAKEPSIITGSFKGLLAALDENAPNNLVWAHQFTEGADHGTNPYMSIPTAVNEYSAFKQKL